jgi:MEMO1 family protein
MSHDPYVMWATQCIRSVVTTGKAPDIPDNLPLDMHQEKAGVFVSIKSHGNLRGCMGTLVATKPDVVREIMSNAVSASMRDPRFPAIKAHELDDLVISVDVLKPSEEIDSIKGLDPSRFGIIVRKGFRTGVLLPGIEGVDTVERQIRIALGKAGINEDEDYVIERFEVERHH